VIKKKKIVDINKIEKEKLRLDELGGSLNKKAGKENS